VTEAVLLSHGYAAIQIDRVAKLAGTTPAAIYRRAKTRGELVVALLVERCGLDPAPDSGDLDQDLLELQELQRDFFTNPIIEAALAGVLGDLRDDDQLGAAFYSRFMARAAVQWPRCWREPPTAVTPRSRASRASSRTC
jgi:AcrR family transcriptional regulator